MSQLRGFPLAGSAIVAGLLAAAPARAASLQGVDDWGASGVPGTTSMYVYVPDNLAANPPILVVAHFCSGTAAAVFDQARGGGLVDASDQYGFIMVVPQTSNNCWDVGSTNALTHDGGGDTQAVAQMVEYTVAQYGANADRVYITGDSSGAMMTQAMLAVYPDVFKGGSAFAGVPAGCWAVNNPDGSWSSPCAGGEVTHTPEEWGDIASAMHPSYMGHRPRVQLFHGDADGILHYTNHEEAIEQWIDVLDLAADPTSTDTVTLGSQQATRERWENACGYVVLEAYTSHGGDHGPSDALFDASFVVPFLGLDDTSDVDPEIAQCNTTGASGAGGTGGAGGVTSSGGTAGADGGPASAGATTSGGLGAGGAGGGVTSTSGGSSTAANVSTGGATVVGTPMTGGGEAATPTSGGMPGTGVGATSATSGMVPNAAGAMSATATATSPPSASTSAGGCSYAAGRGTGLAMSVLSLALSLLPLLRKRRSSARGTPKV